MQDHWIPFSGSKKLEFFDVVTYNNYQYALPGDHKYLAEVFFRIDVNEIIHFRKVYDFGSWLASIAGIEKLLLKWITFFFGGFLQYNATIEIINQHFTKKARVQGKLFSSEEIKLDT